MNFDTINTKYYFTRGDDNAHVLLKFLENDRRVRETVKGREYRIRAEFTKPNGTHGIHVGNCFIFNRKSSNLSLIDERGCPTDPSLITRFIPAAEGNYAEAIMLDMVRFPDDSEVHLQCDVIQCNGRCVEDEDCSQVALAGAGGGGFTKGSGLGRKVGPNEEGSTIAGTTVFVVDPDKAPLIAGNCDEGIRPAWLLWLTITLGVLFLIMLLMNIFLCTAMSCSCANTEGVRLDFDSLSQIKQIIEIDIKSNNREN
uniref:ZP domain-containing protein n=1 Tax=Glossina brevipalpis TaxID=37001 RepID=A0A1A9WJQ4_9MUSC